MTMLLVHNIIQKYSTSSSTSIRRSDCIQSALVSIGRTSRRHTSSIVFYRNHNQSSSSLPPSLSTSSISYLDYHNQICSSCCCCPISNKRSNCSHITSNYYYYTNTTTTAATTNILNADTTTIPAASSSSSSSSSMDDESSSSSSSIDSIDVHDSTREVFLKDYYDTTSNDDDTTTTTTATTTTTTTTPTTDTICNKKKVIVIVLNRPKANAMGYIMIQQLQQCLDYIENVLSSPVSSTNSSILPPRCIIITSYSDKVFCAGADLKERTTMTIEQTEEFVCILRNTIQRIADISIPTISIINGIAVGGGFELILATDIRIGSIQSKYGLPENSLGIIPGAGGTQRLSRLIGIARAKELIFTSQIISATTAYEYGILQHLVVDVPPKTLDSDTSDTSTCIASSGNATFQKGLDIAYTIVNNAPIAIRASKYAIDTGITMSTITDALDIERQAYASILYTNDRIEGLSSFQHGRKPNYNGT